MAYTFYTVIIDRDANTKIPKDVSQWERTVLEQVWGEGNVVEVAEFARELAPIDVESEKARLERIFGRDEDSKTPYVELAFGSGSLCVKGLKRAIEQAVVKDKPADKKA